MSDSNDSLIKDLTKMIPGYGAYVEQEARRSDDRLTREFLVRRLSDCKAKLDTLGKAAVSSGDLESPARIEAIRAEVDHAQSRLAAAVEGYAGWFSERKVDAKLLSEIGQLDSNLVSLVDQLDALAQSMVGSGNVNTAEMSEATSLLHRRIDRRTEMLKAGS